MDDATHVRPASPVHAKHIKTLQYTQQEVHSDTFIHTQQEKCMQTLSRPVSTDRQINPKMGGDRTPEINLEQITGQIQNGRVLFTLLLCFVLHARQYNAYTLTHKRKKKNTRSPPPPKKKCVCVETGAHMLVLRRGRGGGERQER